MVRFKGVSKGVVYLNVISKVSPIVGGERVLTGGVDVFVR